MIVQFGEIRPGIVYVPRPGGYVVLFDQNELLATVMAPAGLALPGGGQEPGETPEQAAIRETCEECGLLVRLGRSIGVADELVFADDDQTYYRKRCTFFLALEIGVCERTQLDHELIWIAPREVIPRLIFASQRWAVEESLQGSRLVATVGNALRGIARSY